jgi:glycosyltransferase involved in cell wall biosynthesis
MHFTRQQACLTRIPSIYHPHDLLHLHLPALLDAADIEWRDATYEEFCRRARMVAVVSSWTKDDVVAHYGVAEERVQVVPYAPTFAMLKDPSPVDVQALRRQFRLPSRYVLYPAQMWPHKNHAGLLRACHNLREQRGLEVPLVFSGRQTEHTARVVSEVRRLDLEQLVTLTGYVNANQLRSLYAASAGIVIPSLFEAGSFPMWDAFYSGVPVAASNVTSLPRQAGGAALLFDPVSVEQIADAIETLWSSETLRNELVARGREVVRPLTWERTARHFRAHYRRILDLPISPADRDLLQAPPLL